MQPVFQPAPVMSVVVSKARILFKWGKCKETKYWHEKRRVVMLLEMLWKKGFPEDMTVVVCGLLY